MTHTSTPVLGRLRLPECGLEVNLDYRPNQRLPRIHTEAKLQKEKQTNKLQIYLIVTNVKKTN